MAFLSSKLARNTLALMAGGSAILILITVLSFLLVNQTRKNTEDVETGRSVRMAASTILSELRDAEAGQRGFLLTQRAEYLEPFKRAQDVLPSAIEELRARLAAAPELEPNLARLEALIAQKIRELSRTVELAAEGRQEEAIEIVNSDVGRKAMEEAREHLDTTIHVAETRVADSLNEMESDAWRLAWLTAFGGVCIALFSATAFFIVGRHTASLVEARREVMSLNETLEERVADRTTALSRANDEIQRFAYIVSHDLRAPLVNIMGFTSELEVSAGTLKTYFDGRAPAEEETEAAKRAAEEEIPEAIHFIRASTSKMDGLIGAILKLSREGRRELKRERVDLLDLFTQAATSLQHQIDTAGATLDLPDALPSVVADRLALEQIFGNLLENAVKYLDSRRPGKISVTGDESGGRVKIRISDNGRGIADQDMERVFELFRRAGSQDRPGEGVGLAHVRALARRLAGDVTVRSKLGEGSTFEVELPKKTKFKGSSAET